MDTNDTQTPSEVDPDWYARQFDESIPFTREHERMLTEMHQAMMQIAAALGPAIEGMKNSPLASMFGL